MKTRLKHLSKQSYKYFEVSTDSDRELFDWLGITLKTLQQGKLTYLVINKHCYMVNDIDHQTIGFTNTMTAQIYNLAEM